MDLFKKGYEKKSLDSERAGYFLNLVKRENYTPNSNYKDDPNLQPPEICYKPSEVILSECRNWFSHHWLQNSFGRFDYFFCTINKFSKHKGMVWHNDHLDGTFITTLIYLTDFSWETQYGGNLELGYVENAHDLKDDPRLKNTQEHLVKKTETIIPRHGSCITVNNLQLTSCHRVSELTTEKIRYTLMFHAGFWNNTSNARKFFSKNLQEG